MKNLCFLGINLAVCFVLIYVSGLGNIPKAAAILFCACLCGFLQKKLLDGDGFAAGLTVFCAPFLLFRSMLAAALLLLFAAGLLFALCKGQFRGRSRK